MCQVVKYKKRRINFTYNIIPGTRFVTHSPHKINSTVILKRAINKNTERNCPLLVCHTQTKNYPGRIPKKGLHRCAYMCTPIQGTTQRPREDPYRKQAGSYFVGKDSQCLSSLALNELVDGAVTTSSGRLFQSDTILCEKKYFLTFSREIPVLSFSECPLV